MVDQMEELGSVNKRSFGSLSETSFSSLTYEKARCALYIHYYNIGTKTTSSLSKLRYNIRVKTT